MGTERSFAETYTMRSTFWQLLGQAGKTLADAYTQADRENQTGIKELAFGALAHSLVEHHGYKPEELTPQPDPLEVLAFIESGMSMTSEQIAARWPEWSKLMAAAYERFERESRAYKVKWGDQARGTSDCMVDSLHAARHHWVYLPLIREVLAKATGQ